MNNIEQALQKLIENQGVPLEHRLWTAAEIAEYLRLSEYTVARRVIVRPGFPTPHSPTGKSNRWFADEVILWARQNRGHLPASRNRG